MNANENLSFAKIDFREIDAVIHAAHAQRARYLAQSLKAVFGGIARLVGTLFEVVSRAAESARLYDELSRMSDRQLADIGLHREDLSRVVAQSMNSRVQVKDAQVVELPAKAAAAELREVKRAA